MPRLSAARIVPSLLVLAAVGCAAGDPTPTQPPNEPSRPPAPTTGALDVSAATTGTHPDANGFTVVVDADVERPLAAGEHLAVAGLVPGVHRVRLGGVASNCTTPDSGVRNVTTIAGATASVAFAVTCGPREITFSGQRRGESAALWSVREDGSDLRPLGVTGVYVAPVWSPDGSRLLVTRPTDNIDGRQRLVMLRPQTGDTATVAAISPFGGDAAWSPDGTRLAFTDVVDDRADPAFGKQQIFTMDADGRNRRRLYVDTVANFHAAWSPDGRSVAFQRLGGFYPNSVIVLNAIWQVDVATGALSRLTPFSSELGYQYGVWAPGGARIAAAGGSALWVIPLDGTAASRVVMDLYGVTRPQWSPNGDRLLYHNPDLTGRGWLMLVDPVPNAVATPLLPPETSIVQVYGASWRPFGDGPPVAAR